MMSTPWHLVLCLLLASSPLAQRSNQELRRLGLDAPRLLELQGVLVGHGDLNGDGQPELLERMTPAGSSLVAMRAWFGSGNGPFQPMPPVELNWPDSVASTPSNRTLADITRDGRIDLVFSLRSFSGGITGFAVLPGAGDGTFAAPVIVPTDPVVEFLFGDMDGDGHADVAAEHVAGQIRELRWWSWQAGTLVSRGALPALSSGFARLLTFDADGDGNDDLVGTYPGQQLTIFPTQEGVPSAGVSTQLAVDPGVMLRADLDRDGLEDLLALRYDGASDSLDLQAVQQGPRGVFSAQPTYEIALLGSVTGRFDAQLLDLNADGVLELGVFTNALEVLPNTGQGDFVPATFARDAPDGEPLPPCRLNGDLYPDLVTESGFLLGTGEFPKPWLTLNMGSQITEGIEDLDGDGDLDLRGDFGGTKRVWHNDGSGRLTRVGSGFQFPATPALGDFIAFGDFDADGDKDHVYNVLLNGIYYNTALLESDGLGTYTWNGVWLTRRNEIPAHSVRAWPTADVDGDGSLDVLARDGWWAGGGMPPLVPHPIPYLGDPMEAADLDGDGDVDVLVQVGIDLGVLWNDGDGAFQTETLASSFFVPCCFGDGLGFLDLDGDGDLDVYAITRAPNPAGRIDLFENLGGRFVPGPSLMGYINRDRPAVGDVNGDGLGDLWVVGGSGTEVAVHLRRPGALAYGAGLRWDVGGRVRGLFDADGDGDVDVLTDRWITNALFRQPEAGRVVQFGAGTAGSGGVVPVLGFAGRARPGAGATAQLRLRRGLGGAPGLLLLGTSRDLLPYPGTSAVMQLVGGVQRSVPLVLGGTPGLAGVGSRDLPAPIDPSLAGTRIVHQLFLTDPGAAEGISASNGLDVQIGNGTLAPRQPNAPLSLGAQR